MRHYVRGNARMPVVELARRLGVSRATVQNRMRRLEREGVIRGYTVELKSGAGEPPIRALALIARDPPDRWGYGQ